MTEEAYKSEKKRIAMIQFHDQVVINQSIGCSLSVTFGGRTGLSRIFLEDHLLTY